MSTGSGSAADRQLKDEEAERRRELAFSQGTPAAFLREWAAASGFPSRWSAADQERLFRVILDEQLGQELVDEWLCPSLAATQWPACGTAFQWQLNALVTQLEASETQGD